MEVESRTWMRGLLELLLLLDWVWILILLIGEYTVVNLGPPKCLFLLIRFGTSRNPNFIT